MNRISRKHFIRLDWARSCRWQFSMICADFHVLDWYKDSGILQMNHRIWLIRASQISNTILDKHSCLNIQKYNRVFHLLPAKNLVKISSTRRIANRWMQNPREFPFVCLSTHEKQAPPKIESKNSASLILPRKFPSTWTQCGSRIALEVPLDHALRENRRLTN
jgi:hypothetical protein